MRIKAERRLSARNLAESALMKFAWRTRVQDPRARTIQ